ncbi:FMRFamide receptor [Elysia marginata]|uniref:FMRFamide receptor n=1 Tax=Elysia marginata TaxID=1093978 RepID=A0AAV4IPS2_9GAST|nr:FMRFamide receptor [Elysia marginata]
MNFTQENTSASEDLIPSNVTLTTPISFQPQNIRRFIFINYILLCNIIAVFGIVSNIMNAVIFWRQGLAEAINVSFFALSLSDLCQLVMVVLVSNFHIPALALRSNFAVFLNRLTYYVCGVLRICFSRISVWITVLITLERCVCILSPLKVRVFFTPQRLSLVIAAIAALILISSSPVFATVKVVKSVEPKTNQTLYSLVVLKLGSSMQDFSVLAMMCTQLLSLSIIVINNVLLLLALKRRKQRWIQERSGVFVLRETVQRPVDDQEDAVTTAGSSGHGAAASALNITIAQSTEVVVGRARTAGPGPGLPSTATIMRDRKLSRMVIILSVILVGSFLPSTVWFCLTRIRPEFQPNGR